MVPEKLSNLEVLSKANVYWDGKVTSRTYFTADANADNTVCIGICCKKLADAKGFRWVVGCPPGNAASGQGHSGRPSGVRRALQLSLTGAEIISAPIFFNCHTEVFP